MSFRWSFEPEPEVKEYRPVRRTFKKKVVHPWVCPEHAKVASSMKRDFPRNDKGEAIGTTRELVIDNRPQVMIPPRPTKIPPRPTKLGWK